MKYYLFLFFFTLSFLFFSCKKGTETTNVTGIDELSNYFDAATTGYISVNDDIRFLLKSELDSNIIKSLDIQSLIKIQPNVEGNVSLINHNLLIFKPKEPLQSATSYQISVDLRKVSSSFDKVISYEIKTKIQDINLANQAFYIREDNKILHTIDVFTADVIDIELLKKCFVNPSLIHNIKEINSTEFEVTFLYDQKEYGKSSIAYDAKAIGVEKSGSLAHYDLTNHLSVIEKSYESGSKEAKFIFSKALLPNQDLNGLIQVNLAIPKYTIDRNILTVTVDNNEENLNFILSQGIKSTDNGVMKEDYTYSFANIPPAPEVSFLDNGIYFPSEGDFKIPIKTRNLKSIRVHILEIKQKNVLQFLTWQSLEYPDHYNMRFLGKPVFDEVVPLNKGRGDTDGYLVHGIDMTSLIKRNPGSIYFVSLDFNIEDVDLSCASTLKKYKLDSNIPDLEFYTRWEYPFRDYYYYDYDSEDPNGYDNRNPCKIEYYQNRPLNSKLLICTDFGLITKKAGNNYLAAVTNLDDASPLNNAEVIFYSLQGEELFKSTTDGNGFVEMVNVAQDVLAVQLSHNNITTYLKMQTYDANDVTSFDVAGERTESEVEAFVYTDRGVYRPGDTIFLDVMLNKPDYTHPSGVPIVVELYNTDNLLIDKKIQRVNIDENLIYHFILGTGSQAKTGRYRCVVNIGSKKIVKGINIETIKPNTTESLFFITNSEEDKILSNFIKGGLLIKYLTGFNVPGAKVVANAIPTINHRPFKNYFDYNFSGHSQVVNTNLPLIDGKTGSDGQVTISSAEDFKNYQAAVNLSIQTETTLANGGTSLEGKYMTVYPFESFIGVKKNKGSLWGDTYQQNDKIELEMVNLDRKGTLLKFGNSVNYQLLKSTRNWWLDKYSLRTQGKYYNEGFWESKAIKNISLTGKGKITLTNLVSGPGLYKVIVTDEKSGHKTEIYFDIYSYDYYNETQSEVKTIRVVTDKEEYKSGEQIKLNIPKIENSKALVTIERGNVILEKFWVETGTDSKEIQLTTNDKWLPNAYINVIQLQPFANENDIPIRTYGIAYVNMIGNNKDIEIQSNISTKLESNARYSFTISEKNGKPMQYTLSIVDEGLLNINGFKTPNPKNHFHAKYPLLVKTWDLYDKLMRYFKGNYAGIIAIGGDDTYSLDNIPEINRFKPIVIHQGVFKIGSKGKNTHTINIPNYVGKLRMMVVACNEEGAFGSLTTSLNVLNPIMVQVAQPRSLNISDKISIPVTISRSDKNITSAELFSKNDPSYIKGYTATTNIKFNQDVMYHNYKIDVQPKAGKTQVEVGIKTGGKGMTETTDILVNYPHPYESKSATFTLKAGESKTINIKPVGYAQAFKSELQVSGYKIPNVLKYATELIQYPYGCLEQVTSASFSQLYLDELLALKPSELKQQKENLEAGVSKILSLSDGKGRFNYWSNGYYESWSDLYAGNFLIEYQRKEKNTSTNVVFNNWLEKMVTTANNWTFVKSENEGVNENQFYLQAYRLFILAKAGKPAKSGMNRFLNVVNSKNSVVYYLLAASYQLAGFESKSRELISTAEQKIKYGEENNGDYYYHATASKAAVIVECLSYFPTQKKNMEEFFNDLVDQTNKSWTSTYTKGYTFLATYKVYGSLKNLNQKMEFKVNLDGKNENISMPSGQIWNTNADGSKPKVITVTNTGNRDIIINQFDRFIDNNLKKEFLERELKLSVNYFNVTKGTPGLDSINLGDDLTCSVEIKNNSLFNYEHMALNYRVASGFELINPRLNNTDYDVKSVKYQDFKDDRVYSFFALAPGQSLNLTFRVKAAFIGDFFKPMVQCEHMYRGDIFARSATGRVVIR